MATPETVARLIQRLDSPYESESLAALKALRRLRETHGVTLGDHLNDEATQDQSVQESAPDIGYRIELERVKSALSKAHWFTFEERAFLQKLSTTPEAELFSEDQMTYLSALFTRVAV